MVKKKRVVVVGLLPIVEKATKARIFGERTKQLKRKKGNQKSELKDKSAAVGRSQ